MIILCLKHAEQEELNALFERCGESKAKVRD